MLQQREKEGEADLIDIQIKTLSLVAKILLERARGCYPVSKTAIAAVGRLDLSPLDLCQNP